VRPNHLAPLTQHGLSPSGSHYIEQIGGVMVSNLYLKICVLCLTIVTIALLFVNVGMYQTFHHLKPLVIRINEVGRAEAVTYDSFNYQPREAEIRYFLMDFVQRHYSRGRTTVREDYARSLYYLDGRLAERIIEENKKNKTIETFLAGRSDEIEVNVNNVAIEDLRSQPYKASVDFEEVYYTAAEHVMTRRERYVGHFVFVVMEKVPNTLIPVNPLGLTITYFREDQAFQ
jgi:type IV secretory pathway TrbF-like protein